MSLSQSSSLLALSSMLPLASSLLSSRLLLSFNGEQVSHDLTFSPSGKSKRLDYILREW